MKKNLSLYFHIPFCLSLCDYCDFFSVKTDSSPLVSDSYVQALCNELNFRLAELDFDFVIDTIYIGGGTPSLLLPGQIEKISKAIFAFPNNADYEFTFEINPDDLNDELIRALEEAGVNRISCGLQSFSQSVLKNVHRRSDSDQVLASIMLLKEKWKGIISADLICGLPGESRESLLNGLNRLCLLKIPHISFYSLCLEEDTPLYQKINSGLVDYNSDFTDELWICGRDFLLEKGYEQYEVSNFCLPGKGCRHNMVYWKSQDYLGFGAGAAGTLHLPGGKALRTGSTNNICDYIKFWTGDYKNNKQIPERILETEKLTEKICSFEYFMMGLRTAEGINVQAYEERFGQPVAPEVRKIIGEWQKKKLMEAKIDEKSENIRMTKEGLLFLNAFLEQIIELF